VLSVQLVSFGDQAKLLLSRDVTELERVETMRRDFVANVSHELRTPLTVVIGFIETVLDMGVVQERGVRPLNLAMNQALRMQRLVEDLLTLSRLESSQNRLQEELVDVRGLVQTLHQEALALSAGRHRVLLAIDTDVQLCGNTEELHSAFGNLVSNAITYTPPGGEIHLSWRLDAGQARFVVQDSGIGIEPKHLPRLTERFYRVDRSRSRETGGTGLGLAIVKHILARHGARLDISSDPGKGSRFAAVFPGERVRVGDGEVAQEAVA
jgi:two-component system phosphate regulon sensor histidine kinase PhoR